MTMTMRRVRAMSRCKSLKTIQAQIEKTQQGMVKAKTRYEKLADELKTLTEQYEQMQALIIADALKKSGKTFDQLMVFLSR